ncbi:excinuclease ABC subunit UvrB [candidate division WWE3 bacterium]|uniref:UvrABC system protein B n=1 Tax=candidate division WWE3 bacterium TaxID=2053526 RepID=A0A7X9HST1_UNCKA|nr:excinuclease ABC subunit UvrB [candidate division WWE3 bacterium]
MFKISSPFKPTGDQPQAIEKLTKNLEKEIKDQVLLGVTGSGKTFVMANVVQNIQKPTLVISHNKTLAAQLYQEFREFFPNNAVEYFVSYYDYYQPESYIPSTDTYIEKDSAINEKIDKLRLSTTTSLMTRKDVIVVSSVSCIYNLGSPAEYSKVAIELRKGMKLRLNDLLMRLSQTHYDRADYDFKRGTYRVTGDVIDIFPAYQDQAIRLEIFNDVLVNVSYFDPLTGNETRNTYGVDTGMIVIYPAKHYITAQERFKDSVEDIRKDLQLRLKELRDNGKQLEAYRLGQRTNYDLEMMQELGYCKGIENYSRYFDGRNPGDAPYTLLDFFPKDYLVIIDESHMTVPQVRGMFNGDRSRKETLINYGFRLPSALDNRPLNFNEFLSRTNRKVYVSATPDDWEIERSKGEIVELLLRPTGIVDPKVTILPTKGQIDDLVERIEEKVSSRQRVLVTTLTKRMAEELSSYLKEKNIKVTYLHSDVDTLERTDILDDLRKGEYDVLVGINLLREGLDLPEVSLVAILDADKEGFLRSETSLIQVMGRAARHVQGEVVMYADNVTGSMKRAINEVERRRDIQLEYNKEHEITPQQITKPIREKLIDQQLEEELEGKKKDAFIDVDFRQLPPYELRKVVRNLEKEMKYEAEILNFERAAVLRDKIRDLRKLFNDVSGC